MDSTDLHTVEARAAPLLDAEGKTNSWRAGEEQTPQRAGSDISTQNPETDEPQTLTTAASGAAVNTEGDAPSRARCCAPALPSEPPCWRRLCRRRAGAAPEPEATAPASLGVASLASAASTSWEASLLPPRTGRPLLQWYTLCVLKLLCMVVIVIGLYLMMETEDHLVISISFLLVCASAVCWRYCSKLEHEDVERSAAEAASQLEQRVASLQGLLRKLPEASPSDLSTHASDDGCCLICLEEYAVDQELLVLPCFHRFHKSCVLRWLEQHAACPSCRLDVLEGIQAQI